MVICLMLKKVLVYFILSSSVERLRYRIYMVLCFLNDKVSLRWKEMKYDFVMDDIYYLSNITALDLFPELSENTHNHEV